jgi:imidazolonepropionase-like amidohydrolase
MKRLILLFAMLFVAPLSLAETIAIVGGTVHTVGPAGTLDNATVIVSDGRISAVGTDVTVPDGATVIDADGKIVTPGLFTPAGSLGLVEVGYSAGPLDAVQRGDQFTASFDVADAYNPRSTLIAVNRIEGVTRALIEPQPAGADPEGYRSHVISGLAAVVNLSGDDNSIDRRSAALVVNLGENGIPYSGTSRISALLTLRNALDEAQDFAEHSVMFERGAHSDFVFSVNDLEALQQVLSGATPLLVNVNRASDIAGLIRLVDEYELRAIVSGGVEAWMLADELASAEIPVILAPEANLPSSFDQLNARSDAAAILAAAGVKLAFADGDANTHNARNITQSAGNATVGGMSREAALQAITLNPAQMYGVADRIGSLEVGKEGDVIVWPGDPFELTNYPDVVILRGEQVEMKSRQTLLRDRYLDPAEPRPPVYRR